MYKIKFHHFIVAILLLSILTGCTLPGFSTPTPFSFPTPDKTMTALFEPTQAGVATSASSDTSNDGQDGVQKTDTPKAPTETPEPTATDGLTTETVEPTETEDAIDPYVGPAVRSGPSITADYMKSGPGVDGDLSGWAPPIQKVITYVVFGKDKWDGKLDSSGSVVAGWNENYLYLGIRVKDDKYVQEATKEQIYLGDSVEILFDRYVSADYNLHSMSADDYQIGISPGKGGILASINGVKVASMPFPVTTVCCDPPEAYIWFPKTEAGRTTEIKIGALEGSEGYQVEMRIPWSLLGVTKPSAGDHYGFAVSISDNDNAGTKKQQTMTSNVETRVFSDPTTWGDLYLKK